MRTKIQQIFIDLFRAFVLRMNSFPMQKLDQIIEIMTHSSSSLLASDTLTGMRTQRFIDFDSALLGEMVVRRAEENSFKIRLCCSGSETVSNDAPRPGQGPQGNLIWPDEFARGIQHHRLLRENYFVRNSWSRWVVLRQFHQLWMCTRHLSSHAWRAHKHTHPQIHNRCDGKSGASRPSVPSHKVPSLKDNAETHLECGRSQYVREVFEKLNFRRQINKPLCGQRSQAMSSELRKVAHGAGPRYWRIVWLKMILND